MISTRQELAEALERRGFLKRDSSIPDEDTATERPWYIGLMLGVAGWFAGIFILILAAILFQPTSGEAALVVGVVLVAAAWGMFKAGRNGAFVSQLALALSIAGQFAILFGANEAMFKGARLSGFALTALVMQVALVFAMPNRLHRTMSALFACVAWALCVRYGIWDQHALGRIGGREPVGASFGPALLGWLVVWAPVAYALHVLIRKEARWMAARREELMRPLATGLILGLAVATLLSHPLESFSWTFGAGGPRQDWLALWPLLSALASLAALAAAFAIGGAGLAGVCVVAALAHMSHFYYAMGTTLMIKALTMLLLGAGLLGAADLLRKHRLP